VSEITFLGLKKKLRGEIWPFPGEAKNLVDSHNKFFLESLIELSQWIKCLQVNNISVVAHCASYVECGKSVITAPYGVVKRVYTIANGDFCSKVFYDSSNINDIECWSKNLLSRFVPPTLVGKPVLQQGLRFADKSSDATCGRARLGLWAIWRKRLYLVPWIQSNESIVVEWDGQKSDWSDSDLLDQTYWTPAEENTIKLYVKFATNGITGLTSG